MIFAVWSLRHIYPLNLGIACVEIAVTLSNAKNIFGKSENETIDIKQKL